MNWRNLFKKILKNSEDKLPIICILGSGPIELVTPVQEDYEENRFDVRCYPQNANLEKILVRDRPNVIITIGQQSSFPELIKAPAEIKKRWLHYEVMPDPARLAIEAFNCYLQNVFQGQAVEKTPLISVFTPTYKPGDKIYRPFRSLREQTYSNWEWVIVDDSDDDGATFKMLTQLAKRDYRIRVFKPWEHSGIIGQLKNWAASLGKGQILVELDHDDELTDYALDYVVKGFNEFPEAGFLYTDCAEVYADGRNLTYREG
ncbi:MAG: glycosyltransferase [Thermodesulfobacteriota bacterium]